MALVQLVGTTGNERNNATQNAWLLPAGCRVGDTLFTTLLVYGPWLATPPLGTMRYSAKVLPDGLNEMDGYVYRHVLTAADIEAGGGQVTFATACLSFVSIAVYRKQVQTAVPIPFQAVLTGWYQNGTVQGKVTWPTVIKGRVRGFYSSLNCLFGQFATIQNAIGQTIPTGYLGTWAMNGESDVSNLAAGQSWQMNLASGGLYVGASLLLLVGEEFQPAYPDRVQAQGELKRSKVYEENAKRRF